MHVRRSRCRCIVAASPARSPPRRREPLTHLVAGRRDAARAARKHGRDVRRRRARALALHRGSKRRPSAAARAPARPSTPTRRWRWPGLPDDEPRHAGGRRRAGRRRARAPATARARRGGGDRRARAGGAETSDDVWIATSAGLYRGRDGACRREALAGRDVLAVSAAADTVLVGDRRPVVARRRRRPRRASIAGLDAEAAGDRGGRRRARLRRRRRRRPGDRSVRRQGSRAGSGHRGDRRLRRRGARARARRNLSLDAGRAAGARRRAAAGARARVRRGHERPLRRDRRRPLHVARRRDLDRAHRRAWPGRGRRGGGRRPHLWLAIDDRLVALDADRAARGDRQPHRADVRAGAARHAAGCWRRRRPGRRCRSSSPRSGRRSRFGWSVVALFAFPLERAVIAGGDRRRLAAEWVERDAALAARGDAAAPAPRRTRALLGAVRQEREALR